MLAGLLFAFGNAILPAGSGKRSANVLQERDPEFVNAKRPALFKGAGCLVLATSY